MFSLCDFLFVCNVNKTLQFYCSFIFPCYEAKALQYVGG